MGWDRYVGRVGALAVALGIGSAVATVPAVAWAQPDESSSAEASETPGRPAADRTTKTADQPEQSATSDDAGTSDAEHDTDAPPSKKRGFGAKRATATSEPSNDAEPDDPGDVGANPIDSEVNSMEVADATAKPALKSVLSSLFAPQASAHHDDEPEAAKPPLLASVLTAVRNWAEERRAKATSTDGASSTPQSSSVTADEASTSIPGAPNGSVVIGSNGTVYQVTTDSGGTRVSIVDNAGNVVSTTDSFAGRPGLESAGVVRPDGSLVIVTSNDTGTRSTVWSVNAQGELTKITTVIGAPTTKPTVGADGALYFHTYVPFIFSPIGTADYRTVRISPTNAVRSFSPDTTVTLAPDGSAYLLSTQFGTRTLRAFGADGKTKTLVLPYEKYGSGPILGEDGYVYLPVGIRTFLGGNTTRLYTFTGASSTTRTLTGLPGSFVVKSDGVYLGTYTYPGTKDNRVDGTTYLYIVTAAAIADPRIIEGRLRSFQVAADGTIYATIYDPSLETTPVVVFSADGTSSTTVSIPGKPPQFGAFNRILGAGEQTDDHGYITYAANGSTYLAVLNPDGSIDRTIELPTGTVPGQVFFGPDGTAYQMNQFTQLGAAATDQILLTLSNDSFSPVVRGPALDGTTDIQFGPDGNGYLILRNDPSIGVQIVGFGPSGLTGVELTLTHPATTPYGSYPVQALVFGPDGTAYVASGKPGDAGVYALTTSVVSKVLDLDTSRVYLSVVGPDGTVYVTAANSDGTTTVHTIPA